MRGPAGPPLRIMGLHVSLRDKGGWSMGSVCRRWMSTERSRNVSIKPLLSYGTVRLPLPPPPLVVVSDLACSPLCKECLHRGILLHKAQFEACTVEFSHTKLSLS